MLRWLGLPVEASAHAARIDLIVVLVHWLMLAMFVGWSIFFIYALVRFRRRAHPKANYGGASGRWARVAVTGVVAAEIVLLVVFSIPTWSARVDAFPAEQQATVVRVVAEQFIWNIQYPGPDGVFGRTRLDLVNADNPLGLDITDPAAKDDVWTQNQLNLPVGRPVIVHLSSKDVIHSFGLPQMRVKQDAIPGIEQRLWFTPTKTGEWRSRARSCAASATTGCAASTPFRRRPISTPGSQASPRGSEHQARHFFLGRFRYIR